MGLIDRLFARKSSDASQQPPQPDFGGGRASVSSRELKGGVFGALPKRTLRELGLDDRSLKTYSVFDLMDVLTDSHPDLSYALWNFIRMGNSGYTYSVKKLGSGKAYPQAEKDIEELLQRLSTPNMVAFEKSRSLEKVIDQFFISGVTRGAIACEMVLTSDKADIAFIAPVDPSTIDFKLEGGRYIPYQNTIKLDMPTFIYEGIDERIDDPYGRSPFVSALTIILFQLQVLNDIKAVVHNQGYPRLDIKLLEELMLKRMPISVRNNETKKETWLKERLSEIIAMYSALEPDETFVHYDSIEIGDAGGKGGALIDPDKLMKVIDNLIITGLKTLATVLGRSTSGSNESHAKLEIKLYLQSVRGIQAVIERVIAKALTIFLNLNGKQGIVTFSFKPLEIRTDLEMQQMLIIKLQNIAYMRDQGWIDQDEAARLAVGHDPVAEPNWDALGGGSTRRNADGSPAGGTTDSNPRAGGSTSPSTGN